MQVPSFSNGKFLLISIFSDFLGMYVRFILVSGGNADIFFTTMDKYILCLGQPRLAKMAHAKEKNIDVKKFHE